METIRLVEEYRRCSEVKMHMKAWTVLNKEQVDPGANMLLIARILDSEKQPAEDIDAYDHRRSITSCSIANFIFNTDDARKIARDLLFSVTSSDDDAYEWSAALRTFLEVELFHFSYRAASTMADYFNDTRYKYGGIQVLVDISRPLKKQKIVIISENNGELVESVGDNFELLERVDDPRIQSTADSNYIRKDGGL